VPHRSPVPDHDIRFASIDHAMWFHRDARADEWLLYEAETPSAIGGTGLTRGQIFDRAGRLIASTSQDALQAPR
jgi:acyl-CoA thioesterase II